MPIDVKCDRCGTRLRAPDTAAGKTKRCPKCGGPLPIPAPSGTDEADDLNLYELAVTPSAQPEQQQAPDSVIISRKKVGDAQARGPVSANLGPSGGQASSPFGAYAAAIAAEGEKHGHSERGPLLTVLGLDLTVGRLIGAGVAALALIALGLWWTMFGPGRTHAILAIQPVYVTPAIHRGELREPYSLLSMQGDMGVGIKGADAGGGAGSHPAASMFKSASGAVYSLGGGSDQLLVARESEAGDHLMVEVELSQALMNRLGQTSRYDIVFRADRFTLQPANGGPPSLHPRVLFAEFEGRADVDLAGASSTNYQALLPPGAPPTTESFTRTGRKITGGKLHYSGEAGIRGDLDFAVSYNPDAPTGHGGFHATGDLKLTDPGGAVVDMQYQGGTLVVSWNAGSRGYWSRDNFTEPGGDSPFRKFKVRLLFERPHTDQPLRLNYAGKTIGTLPKRYNAEDRAPASSSGAGVMTYFSLLAQARDKARGTITDSNMVQIATAIAMYTDQQRGWLPDRLDDLRPIMPGIDGVLENKRTGENPGFVYVKPAKTLGQIEDPAGTVILYESKGGRADPDGSKLYADGRLEPRSP